MKIGYPVINQALGHISSHTFRLALLSEERLFKTIQENLDSVEATIHWNMAHNLLFYRIGSGIIPFGSHANMSLNWQDEFKERIARIGEYIKANNMRISMHPGQYVVLNSPSDTTFANSVRELAYNAELLDMLGLDSTHKFQFHLGGIHGDRDASTQLFIKRYNQLPENVRRRLVIENDERVASLAQCMEIHKACGIPVLFDTLHHEVNNNGETVLAGLKIAASTWGENDGTQMIDYSTQNPDKKTGAHAVTLDVERFRSFIKSLKNREVDIMLEIKNKEASALQAVVVLNSLDTPGF